jgi:hypothetical protein
MFLTLGIILLSIAVAIKLAFVIRKIIKDRKEFKELFH